MLYLFLVLLVLCHSLQIKRLCSGVSFTLKVGHSVDLAFVTLKHGVSCFQPCNFRNFFLRSIFKRMALSVVKFLWDMVGTIFLYFMRFEFSHLLVYLLMESILIPWCISEGDSWVLGCKCFAFFEAVFAHESASSFSLIPWWAGHYTILMFCTFRLISMRFSWMARTVELW